MGTRHEGSMPRPVKRAVTAAVEYGVARAGIAAVRVLDRDVIGQAHHPRGGGGRMAIASQPRCPGATAGTSRSAAREIEGLLRDAGFAHLSTQALPLSPPVACVLAASPG